MKKESSAPIAASSCHKKKHLLYRQLPHTIRHNKLVQGTIILTATGFLTRILGFFYRIFLSRVYGEEGMGIYQLITPVLALVFALCAAGIQTSISKYVAGETTTHDYHTSWKYLCGGLILSVALSALCTWFVYSCADSIAVHFIGEPRTAPLFKVLAFSFTLSAVHSCINGYYYGIRRTALPAATQFIEQLVRVAFVYLLYLYCEQRYLHLTIGGAVLGLVVGEAASTLISLVAILFRFYGLEKNGKAEHSLQSNPSYGVSIPRVSLLQAQAKIFRLAAPLSLNRIVLNLLASLEAVMIPRKLLLAGLTMTDALKTYGVLTGMALPLILFPCAITNSVSVLLLPVVSEAQVNNNEFRIAQAVRKSCAYCLSLGFLCAVGFFILARPAGELLFSSQMAGTYVQSLCFICPFLYLTSTLSSILHGLGKTGLTFLFNLCGLSVRLFFVFFLIPRFGILAYLWGLLLSQLVIALLNLLALRKYILYNRRANA